MQREIDFQCALKMLLVTLSTAQMDKKKSAEKQNIQAPWVGSWTSLFGVQSHPFVDITF